MKKTRFFYAGFYCSLQPGLRDVLIGWEAIKCYQIIIIDIFTISQGYVSAFMWKWIKFSKL